MVSQAAKRTIFILFMPVVTAEFLTGSTSLYSLLDPLTLPLLLGLYGVGAILIRETAVAWKKGWPTVMALGAAYGVVEEGLDVKSWFNPSWPALGSLASYGRVFGINIVWAVELTIFHAIFSITIPILLTSLLFPEQQGKRWFSTKTLGWLAIVFAAAVTFGFVFFPYTPPIPQYLVAIAIAAFFVSAARRLPVFIPGGRVVRMVSGARLVALGFLCSLSFFLIFWVIPLTPVPPFIDLVLMFILGWGVCGFLAGTPLSDYDLFSLVAGALGPLMVVAFLGMNFLAGPPFVSAGYIVALCAIGRRIRARDGRAPVQNLSNGRGTSFGPDNLHLPTQK